MPFKRAPRALVTHLEKPEMDALLAAPDLEMKTKALANCEIKGKKNRRPWKEDKSLMEFLRTL